MEVVVLELLSTALLRTLPLLPSQEVRACLLAVAARASEPAVPLTPSDWSLTLPKFGVAQLLTNGCVRTEAEKESGFSLSPAS